MIFALLFNLFFMPCEFEDSSNCTWYANIQGNTQGESFTNISDTTIFWEKN